MFRERRNRRSGVLAPGDVPPPSLGGLYDYRNVLSASSFRRRDEGEFRLGKVVDLKSCRGVRPVGLFAGELERHAAIVGPSGSGKTHSLVIPWIAAALNAGASVVAVDVKGDLFEGVDNYRRSQGLVFGCLAGRLDYTRPSESLSWNWIESLRSRHGGEPESRSIAGAAEAVLGKSRENDSNPFWHNQDVMLLQNLLELALVTASEPTADTLLALANSQQRLQRAVRSGGATRSARDLHQYSIKDIDDFQRDFSGLRVALSELADPKIEQITRSRGFDFADCLQHQYFAVVTAPLGDGKLSESFSALAVNRISQLIYQRLSDPGGQHVVLVVDEAARLAGRFNFEELLAVGRSAGISVVLALQDVAQIRDTEQRSAILSNCNVYISLAGVSAASAEFLSKRIGSTTKTQQSVQYSPSGRWKQEASRSYSQVQAAVLGDREIMSPPFGPRSAVVHCRDISDQPFVVDLTRG